jgi:hypothetical protein
VLLTSLARLLMILPGGARQDDTGRSFSFIDFIQLFPNVDALKIRWQFYEQGDPRLHDLDVTAAKLLDARRNPTEDDQDSVSKVTTLTIQTLDPFDEDHRDLDHEHVRQLRCLLQQLHCPRMSSLYLDFGSWYGLHFAGSDALWTALIDMFAMCQSEVLEELQLGCRMVMNGRAIGFDFCVSQARAKDS